MYRLGFVCSVAIVLGTTARSRAEEPARAVLNKAIEAHGGAEALARFKAFAYSQAGTVFGADGAPHESSAKIAYQLPDKLRYERRTPDGTPIVVVFDGAHGWVKVGDKIDEMKPGQVAANKELMYLLVVTSLAPLRDPIYTLTDLGNSTVQGRMVAGIKVSCAGHPDVNLYFDRDSGLLYRLTTRSTDAQSGKQQDREEVTWDYRKASEMKIAMYFKLWEDDKPRVEMKLSDVKCAEKHDDHLFTKP